MVRQMGESGGRDGVMSGGGHWSLEDMAAGLKVPSACVFEWGDELVFGRWKLVPSSGRERGVGF